MEGSRASLTPTGTAELSQAGEVGVSALRGYRWEGLRGMGPGCGALQVYKSLCTRRCVYTSPAEPKAGLGPPAPPAGDSLELARGAAMARGRGP